GRDRGAAIYVGESGGEMAHELVEKLKKRFMNVSILMIPEEGSKKTEIGMNLTKDEKSALVIYQRAKSQV
ncbi:MAG: hypothetical protein QXP38_06105, partial [Nitrososphaerota archaeon]